LALRGNDVIEKLEYIRKTRPALYLALTLLVDQLAADPVRVSKNKVDILQKNLTAPAI
jgi:hypothetical protein